MRKSRNRRLNWTGRITIDNPNYARDYIIVVD